ncbi:hypothetical protein COCVIDRAFT_106971, partial [Bipolaris victoriae FI3]
LSTLVLQDNARCHPVPSTTAMPLNNSSCKTTQVSGDGLLYIPRNRECDIRYYCCKGKADVKQICAAPTVNVEAGSLGRDLSTSRTR